MGRNFTVSNEKSHNYFVSLENNNVQIKILLFTYLK